MMELCDEGINKKVQGDGWTGVGEAEWCIGLLGVGPPISLSWTLWLVTHQVGRYSEFLLPVLRFLIFCKKDQWQQYFKK